MAADLRSVPTKDLTAPATVANLYTRDPGGIESPATAELFRRYHVDGDQEAYWALCMHFAPLARINARILKNRRPGYFINETVEDLTSDGFLGLMLAVRQATIRPLGTFRSFAHARIQWAIYRHVANRSWMKKHALDSLNVVAQARQELFAHTGRLPSAGELAQAVASRIDNVNFYVDHQPKAESLNGSHNAIDPAPGPDERAMAAEACDIFRRAIKHVHGVDRRMLKLLLGGAGVREIGRQLGIDFHKVSRRISGLLWEVRCRADLAESLGVQPAELPHVPPRKHRPHVSSLGPAKLAM